MPPAALIQINGLGLAFFYRYRLGWSTPGLESNGASDDPSAGVASCQGQDGPRDDDGTIAALSDRGHAMIALPVRVAMPVCADPCFAVCDLPVCITTTQAGLYLSILIHLNSPACRRLAL